MATETGDKFGFVLLSARRRFILRADAIPLPPAAGGSFPPAMRMPDSGMTEIGPVLGVKAPARPAIGIDVQ